MRVALLPAVAPKVARRLIGRDRDQWHALVARTEPHNLGARRGLIFLVALLFLGRDAARPEQHQRAGEDLSRHALNNRDDVTRKRGWTALALLLVLDERELRAFHLEVVARLVCSAHARRHHRSMRAFLLALFLVDLVALGLPHLVRIQQLDRHNVPLERAVPVLGATDKNVVVQHLGRHPRVAAVPFVHAQHTHDELAGQQQRRQTGLRKVAAKQGFARGGSARALPTCHAATALARAAPMARTASMSTWAHLRTAAVQRRKLGLRLRETGQEVLGRGWRPRPGGIRRAAGARVRAAFVRRCIVAAAAVRLAPRAIQAKTRQVEQATARHEELGRQLRRQLVRSVAGV